MTDHNVLYLTPFLLSALLSFGLAGYASAFFNVRGAKPFAVLTLIQSVWTISMVFEILSPTLAAKQNWDNVQWVLVFLCALAVYWFTVSLLPNQRFSKLIFGLMAIFPIIFILIMARYPEMVYQAEYIQQGAPFDTHEFEFSFIDWVAFAYVFAILYYCVAVLIGERRYVSEPLRRQMTWALVGIFIQSFMYQFLFITGFTFMGQRDTAPVTFLVGNILMAWGLFRTRIFELGSMARSQVVENMPDGFIVTDPKGTVIDMNRAASVFALPNWDRKPIVDVFPGWAVEISPDRLGASFTQDFARVVKGNKRFFELRVAPLSDAHKNLVGHLVVVHDISHRKLLESALAANEARYRSIIDSMAEGIIIYEQNGGVVSCNQAAEAIIGIACETIRSLSRDELAKLSVHENGTAFTVDELPLEIALRNGKAVRDVLMGIKSNSNDLKWLLTNAQPFIFVGENMEETQQVIISFRDVTEMRRMQAEATQAQINHERTRMLAQFVESASHEFRTPLTTIGTSIYLMMRQTDMTKRQHHAEIAEGQIKRIEQLLDTLVNMVRLDSSTPLKLIPTQMEILLNSVLVHFEKLINEHHLTVRMQQMAELSPIHIDNHLMRIALEHILDNAIRFTPDGGKIDIRLNKDNKHFVVEIEDSGQGIAETELNHIFDSFWRRDAAHTTPGFGLGMSIVQKVVQQHAGIVEVESEVGRGTTVTIRLPLSDTNV